MKMWKKALLIVMMAALVFSLPMGSAWAKTIKLPWLPDIPLFFYG